MAECLRFVLCWFFFCLLGPSWARLLRPTFVYWYICIFVRITPEHGCQRRLVCQRLSYLESGISSWLVMTLLDKEKIQKTIGFNCLKWKRDPVDTDSNLSMEVITDSQGLLLRHTV